MHVSIITEEYFYCAFSYINLNE